VVKPAIARLAAKIMAGEAALSMRFIFTQQLLISMLQREVGMPKKYDYLRD
jgi:hypothetical protein